jgi:hypothetical protein
MGDFDFASDTFKIALYTNSASLNAETTAYTQQLVRFWFRLHGWWEYLNSLQRASQVVRRLLHLQTLRWSAAITARGALIYKDGGAVQSAY